MKVKKISLRFLVITFGLAFISLGFSLQVIQSQTAALSLAKVLTGLQSKSGGFTLAQKNEFITKKVLEVGVTFRLTPDIESELKIAGATAELIRAIRSKAPRTRETPRPSEVPEDEKPNADFEKIWVDQNLVEDGVKGISIKANFTVYNLKGIDSEIVYRFKKDGVLLKGSTIDYKTTTGDLSARRLLAPAYSATVYTDLDAFVPYTEFNLSPGTHNLVMESAVILKDGTLVKFLTSQNVRLVIPSASTTINKKGSATFDTLWVDFGVTQEGKIGMLVHVKLTVNDLKDEDVMLQLLFEKQDGTKLYSNNKTYRDPNGQTAAYRNIRPIYDSALFSDVSAFIPYSEFNLPVGKYDLKIHADLVYSDYSVVTHLNYYPFTYTRSK